MEYALRIPKGKVAYLREVEEKVERMANVEIEVASDGGVVIRGDSLNAWIATQVVKAIGRGFKAEDALLLLDENFSFALIDVRDYGKGKKAIWRLKGRVIGERGRAKLKLEELTKTRIVVSGRTIGIIGEVSRVEIARRAIEMLLEGARHGSVYRFIDRKLKET